MVISIAPAPFTCSTYWLIESIVSFLEIQFRNYNFLRTSLVSKIEVFVSAIVNGGGMDGCFTIIGSTEQSII